MRYLKFGMIAVGFIWLATIASTLFWYLAPGDNFLGITSKASAEIDGRSPGSLGTRRYIMLVEATRKYQETDQPVSKDIADGVAFAPVSYLNSELQRLGVKWRVRSAEGLEAKIYEVS